MANLVDYARQTSCYVTSSDVTGACDDRISYGCSVIVAPDGSIIARIPEFGDGFVVFDLPDFPKMAGLATS
ncbi:nitrilase-related carbon-nitrogen hydrolase [Sphingomonas mollis]|uniref:CN hydrolase domain-containing protein n=1 Tax=Sphingomonas mollis TaxID=2795726 RepID=A0ABS0XLV7_9SPHN|nr:nitrilase-related carbon-nitrogen hydrolase [Sphingomonas sp. BT553]MBJ6120708.1 hypothetical protein [Sphingomonas sp. BT553]